MVSGVRIPPCPILNLLPQRERRRILQSQILCHTSKDSPLDECVSLVAIDEWKNWEVLYSVSTKGEERGFVPFLLNPWPWVEEKLPPEDDFCKRDLPTDKALLAWLSVFFFQTDLRRFFFVFEVRFFGTAIINWKWIKKGILLLVNHCSANRPALYNAMPCHGIPASDGPAWVAWNGDSK